ncbi:MAG: thioredoxin family protein [Planctomycetota bacterium]|nr:thioredoxin family protein [Planctomycetota bacterium]
MRNKKIRCASFLIAMASILGLGAPAPGQSDPGSPPSVDWQTVLGPAQGEWPDPLPDVQWREHVRGALLEARSTGRPLFVTFRCLPCKQCADFDKDVLEGSPDLTPLLKQFITVRLTDANDLDLNVFPAQGFQDLDLSWWGYFLSPQGRVYGIFGGRDHVSDSTRISEAALVNTLKRVLAHHYDPRRALWDIDGPAPDLGLSSRGPNQLEGYDSWAGRRDWVSEQNCLHCHQVAEVFRQPAIDAGTFKKNDADLRMWPLPENVGLEVDRDHGLLIKVVEPDSAAASAGLQSGDILAAAGGRRLFGQADFRGVLHRQANPTGSIDVQWWRDDRLMSGTLKLESGWRETVLNWRASISGGNIGAHTGFAWPNKGPRDAVIDREPGGSEGGGMSIRPWLGNDHKRWPAYAAGLRDHHVIVAVDGESPDLFGRPFLVWFRLRHEPGDEVTLTVRDGDELRKITYRLPSP